MVASNFERWEVLVRNNKRAGVRYRAGTPHMLLTRLIVADEHRPYLAESRVHLEPQSSSWELSWFQDNGMPYPQLMRRKLQKLPVDSMPSSADYLMMLRAINNPEEELAYLRLTEAAVYAQDVFDAASGKRNARIIRVREETLAIPQGLPIATQRFEVWVDGMLVVTHWVGADEDIVASQWGSGLKSYKFSAITSRAEWYSLSGLDSGAQDFLTSGFGSHL